MSFTYRLATLDDEIPLKQLILLAVEQLQKKFLTSEQIMASKRFMGLDKLLITDNTYFIVLQNQSVIGCGGWSFRRTLYGGDLARNRDNAYLEPSKDAAKIRAMYTHPNFVRQGIGKKILQLCEQAMMAKGYKSCELMSTLSGVPLYQKCGYQTVEHTEDATEGIPVPLVKMTKSLDK